ncbi:MAG TPA: hypothetical protein PLW68_02350 [Casimicrobiaceae bacterium]|nr:hypothetical protein [Casimicrobiaceae bacterium]
MNPADVDCRHELNAPTVIGEAIDEEVMVIDLTTGVYFSLTGAGALVWPGLIAGATPTEIAVAGSADPNAVAQSALAVRIADFAGRLRSENILRPRPPETAPDTGTLAQLPRIASAAQFACERFDDMQAMLLADPVHDVGGRGWPDVAGPPDK